MSNLNTILKHLSVRARLSFAFGLLTLLIVHNTALAVKELGDSNERLTMQAGSVGAPLEIATGLRSAIDRRAIAQRDLVLVNTPSDIKVASEALAAAERDVQTRLKQLDGIGGLHGVGRTPEEGAAIAEISQIEGQYRSLAAYIGNEVMTGRHDDAITEMNQRCKPLFEQLKKATDRLVANVSRREERELLNDSERYPDHRGLLIAVCAVTVVVAVVATLLITRSITRALGAEPTVLSELTGRIADGDLRPVGGGEEAPPGSVLASISTMQKSLVKLIGQVQMSAESIATGSREIAAGNVDLSSRTGQQALSLRDTASSVEEITSAVRQNADNAQQASSLATSAAEVAQKGSEVVGEVIGTMTRLGESSSRITEITGMIEGIAFQTNILALNAAVEAVRAGEQGRGFTVVASEVRGLAQRSANAAREIKDLVTSSVHRIQDGSALSGEAGKTMAEIMQVVVRVKDIMGEIAVASSDQSRNVERVNQAIKQLEEVTEQNVALVEEATTASRSLESQGRLLNDAIALFQLDGWPFDGMHVSS